MSFSTNMKILAASSSLLALVSCGGSHSSKSHTEPQREAVCSTADCAAAMKWKILLQGRSFPNRGSASVDINGVNLLNECVGKSEYNIDRSTDPQSITMESYATPVQGELKITVMNCKDSSVIFSQDNVPFDIVKDAGGASEVLVNL